jgi:hypothetical protein
MSETISAASGLTQKASDQIPYCRSQGIPYLVGAAMAGMAIQAAQVTQVGAAPFSVVLEDHGLARMGNDSYVVIPHGETAGRVTIDQDTITRDGFDLLGGADTEVIHLLIVGRIAGQLNGE